jgi:hypothetical protein
MSKTSPPSTRKSRTRPPTKQYLLEKYGADYYKRLAKLGNNAQLKKYGADYYKRLSKLGNDELRKKYGKDRYKILAKLGNDARLKKYGKDELAAQGRKAYQTLMKRFKTEEEGREYLRDRGKKAIEKALAKYGRDHFLKAQQKGNENYRRKRVAELTSIIKLWITDLQTLQETVTSHKSALIDIQSVQSKSLTRFYRKIERHKKSGQYLIEELHNMVTKKEANARP